MALPGQLPPPSGGPLATPVPIIGPQYCVPYPVDLAIVKKSMFLKNSFVFTDINGKIVFEVKNKKFSFSIQQVLLDAAGNNIVTVRRKPLTHHARQEVFRGDGTDPSNLLFTLKLSSMFKLKNKDVFLANNPKQEVCDFKVVGNQFERSCIVYAGESSTIIAQMHKKDASRSVLKDKFIVKVSPNIDYAFIAALIVILDEIHSSSQD